MKSELSPAMIQEVNRKELDTNLTPHELGKLLDSLVALEVDLINTTFGIY